MPTAAFDVLVKNAREVLTLTGPEGAGEAALGAISRGAVGIRSGRIAYLGPESALPEEAVGPGTRVVDAAGGFVGPGFVDPHTHLVFGGERAKEFELRAQGRGYLEIAQAGGGIANTVRATRAASEEELVAWALPRLRRLLEWGVTTAEVKSGYGLTLEDELKMLRVIRRLSALQPVTLVPTLLCAHALPEEYRDRREAYVSLCAEEIVPRAAEEGLATFCDAFVEQGAFTADEARRILGAAKQAGLVPRLHVDQLTSGAGAELAAELGAACADHLEEISDAGIQALARSGVTAVLVPVSTLFLRQARYAPGRKLRDAGVPVALATNVNPGSAMSENLGLTLGLACLQNGLTAAEAFEGITRSAARALRLPEAGRLAVGGPADLVVFDAPDFRHLPYHLGVPHTAAVLKSGQVAYERGPGPSACSR